MMCDLCKEMAERIAALEARVTALEQPSTGMVHEINVSGTGDAQISEGLRQAIEASFDRYACDFLPGAVRAIAARPRFRIRFDPDSGHIVCELDDGDDDA